MAQAHLWKKLCTNVYYIIDVAVEWFTTLAQAAKFHCFVLLIIVML